MLSLIKEDTSMKSYNEKEPLYLDADALGVGLQCVCWNELYKRHSTRQNNSLVHSICQQEPIQCQNPL